ncbi:MAG: hypothetical protein ACYDCO_01085 [Armatimonadota bacterium]
MVFRLSRRQHLQIAALLWILVGATLAMRGTSWVMRDDHTRWLFAAILPLSIVAGYWKGAALMSKSASRAAERIRLLAERTPIWQLYSPSMYLLVAGMIALGVASRWAGAHWHVRGFVGILYLVVGIGLIIGSRPYWQARKYLS